MHNWVYLVKTSGWPISLNITLMVEGSLASGYPDRDLDHSVRNESLGTFKQS